MLVHAYLGYIVGGVFVRVAGMLCGIMEGRRPECTLRESSFVPLEFVPLGLGP